MNPDGDLVTLDLAGAHVHAPASESYDAALRGDRFWAGVRFGKQLARSRSFDVVHARSHIPATIALELKKHNNPKMIFDVRGLLADEYVDAGHWRKGSLAYRITKKAETKAMLHADAIVTLTERIWPIIRQWDGLRDREVAHEVIPCCADLDKFSFSDQARTEYRRTLEVQTRLLARYLTGEIHEYPPFATR